MFCSLAILTDTRSRLCRSVAQQTSRPQIPSPLTIRASCLALICRSSMRVRKRCTRSFTRSRKSTRLSAENEKSILLRSKRHSTSIIFIGSCRSAILLTQNCIASRSNFWLLSRVRKSSSVATRRTSFRLAGSCSSGAARTSVTAVPIAGPLSVITTTGSPFLSGRSAAWKV